MTVSETLKVLVILDPTTVPNPIDVALAAVAGGATALQIRMKDSHAADLLRWTLRIQEAVGIPLWVNDRADVALAAGVAGVHLGAEDVPAGRLRAVAQTLRLGVSVGDEREAGLATGVTVDYWSVGAVFPTATKPDAGLPIGIAGFASLAARAPAGCPVLAIGGVTATAVEQLVACGA